MPLYDFDCPDCGRFDANRALADFARACPCPSCGAQSPRALSVPSIPELSSSVRKAHAVNERSRHEPRRHAAGCFCCRPKPAPGAAKSSGSRPWMISH